MPHTPATIRRPRRDAQHHAAPCGPRRLAAAFTLIELLVVMGIIVILAGLVVAGSAYMWSMAQVKRTQGTINLLALSLEDFKQTYGKYPYHDKASDSGPYWKFSGPLDNSQTSYDIRNLYYVLRDRACLKNPVESRYLSKIGSAGNDSDYAVLDAWGNPVVYRFPRNAGDGQYDLWSMGPDAQDSRSSTGDTIDPTDVSDARNADNIVWGAFERR